MPEISYCSHGIGTQDYFQVFGTGFLEAGFQLRRQYFDSPWDNPSSGTTKTSDLRGFTVDGTLRRPEMVVQEYILGSGVAAHLNSQVYVAGNTSNVGARVYTGNYADFPYHNAGRHSFILWPVSNAGVGSPYYCNQPKLWFMETDGPLNVIKKGIATKVWGENLRQQTPQQDVLPKYYLHDPIGDPTASNLYPLIQHGRDGQRNTNHEEQWSYGHFTVPTGVPDGTYDFYMYLRSGGIYSVASLTGVQVVTDFVQPSYNYFYADTFGLSTTSPDNGRWLQDALIMAGSSAYVNNGSRSVVVIPQGTYKINSRLVIPSGVDMVGVGKTLSHLEFTGNIGAGFNGTPQHSIPWFPSDVYSSLDSNFLRDSYIRMTEYSSIKSITLRDYENSMEIMISLYHHRNSSIVGCHDNNFMDVKFERTLASAANSPIAIHIDSTTTRLRIERCESNTSFVVAALNMNNPKLYQSRAGIFRYNKIEGDQYGKSVGFQNMFGFYNLFAYNDLSKLRRGFVNNSGAGPNYKNVVYRNKLISLGNLYGECEAMNLEAATNYTRWYYPITVSEDRLQFSAAGWPWSSGILAQQYIYCPSGPSIGTIAQIKDNTADGQVILTDEWSIRTPNTGSAYAFPYYFGPLNVVSCLFEDTTGGVAMFRGNIQTNVISSTFRMSDEGLYMEAKMEWSRNGGTNSGVPETYGCIIHPTVQRCYFNHSDLHIDGIREQYLNPYPASNVIGAKLFGIVAIDSPIAIRSCTSPYRNAIDTYIAGESFGSGMYPENILGVFLYAQNICTSLRNSLVDKLCPYLPVGITDGIKGLRITAQTVNGMNDIPSGDFVSYIGPGKTQRA